MRIAVQLCKLHLLQFYRLLVEIGLLRVLFLTVIIIIISLRFTDKVLIQSPWSGFLTLIFLLPITFHSREKGFLNSLDLKPFKLRFLRNMIFSTPLILLFIFSLNFKALILCLTLILILALDLSQLSLRNSSKSSVNINLQLLPWTVGIRDNIQLIILFALASLSGIFHEALIFIGVIGFHFVILNFLRYNEDQNLIESYQLKTKAFLSFYTKKFLSYYLILQLPILIYTFILYPVIGIIHLAILLLLVIHTYISIQLKFSSYKPGDTNDGAQMIQTMSFFFLLIPFTMPISFWYAYRFNKMAKQNLKVYLEC
jgi:hypothetical protein